MQGLWPILNSFLHRMKLTDLVSFFSYGYPVPQHSWRERVPFLQFFDTFVKSELSVAVWTGFWSCCYVLLVSSLPPNSRLLVVVTYDLIVIFFCSRLLWLVKVFRFPCEYRSLMGIELNLCFQYYRHFPSVWQYMSMGGHCIVQCHLLCLSLML